MKNIKNKTVKVIVASILVISIMVMGYTSNVVNSENNTFAVDKNTNS